MLNLFLKDVKAGAIFLWAVVPLTVVTALQVSRSGSGFFWANVTCAGLIVVAVSMLEWKNDAEPFVHSLPVTRAMVVRARYLTAAAIGLLSLAIGAIVGAARAVGLATQGSPWPRWVAGDMALAFLLAFAVIAAIFLPCHFRWGFGKGNIAAALVIAGGVIVSSAAGPAITGIPTSPSIEAAYIGVPAGLIPQGVARLVERFGLAAGGIMVLGVAGAVLWLSSEIAVRAHRRQEF
jgi:hypothetical protein